MSYNFQLLPSRFVPLHLPFVRSRPLFTLILATLMRYVILYAGWWQYDERTSKELEGCYKSGERTCELLIAGFLYVADLDMMLQTRKNDLSYRRRIKRDLATAPKKGIAGIRTAELDDQFTPAEEYINPSLELQRPHSPTEGRTDNLTPATPSNTPQTPISGRESPHDDGLVAAMQRLHLHYTS